MHLIPTYRVTIEADRVYRVPEDDLESFLKVLIFNECKKLTVEEENRHDHTNAFSTPRGG